MDDGSTDDSGDTSTGQIAPGAVIEAAHALVLAEAPIDFDTLAERLAAMFTPAGADGDTIDDVYERVSDIVTDECDRVFGTLTTRRDGTFVSLPALFGPDTVATFRLGSEEKATGVLRPAIDLAPVGFRREVRWQGEPVRVAAEGVVEATWTGPSGWLDGFEVGTVVAVRVAEDGELSLTEVDEPGLDDDLVAEVDRAFTALDTGMVVVGIDLAVEMAVADPTTFEQPHRPLSELATDAGLEIRGAVMARDTVALDRWDQVVGSFDDDILPISSGARAAVRLLRRVVLLEDPPRDELRTAARLLADPEVAVVSLHRVFAIDGELIDAIDGFLERLLGAASRGDEQAMAHWLAGMVAEHRGDIDTAIHHFDAGHRADRAAPPLAERLAWYRFQQGDLDAAARLWAISGSAEASSTSPELRAIDRLAQRQAMRSQGPTTPPGRNEPCWCGSGRKYKHCHLDAPAEAAPLADRMELLYTKAATYLLRSAAEGRAMGMHLAEVLFGEAPTGGHDHDGHDHGGHDEFDNAEFERRLDESEDPLVVDLVLHEGGVFAQWLATWSSNLPADEREMAESWAGTVRTLLEVLELRPGVGLRVRDRRSGSELDVNDVRASTVLAEGDIVCTRLVTAGDQQRLLPGTFNVPAERCDEVLAALITDDAFMLANVVRAARDEETGDDDPGVAATPDGAGD